MPAPTITELPSAVYIRERLNYDPETGVFVWRYCEAMRREWNTRWAGKDAGSFSGDRYRRIRINGGLHLAHRIAWIITHGDWPADQIDHINGDPSDNRISNLRTVSNAENGRNQAIRSDNTSGVMGVCWDKSRGKWQASIMVDQRQIHIGRFTDLADAIAARAAAEIAHGFHQNHGRTPS